VLEWIKSLVGNIVGYNNMMDGFLKDIIDDGYMTHVLICSVPELDDKAYGVDNDDVDIRMIKGEECLTKEELWLEWSTVPDSFKGDWDVFDECLQDLSWLSMARGRVLVVENFDLVLSKDLEELMTLLDIINDALISQKKTPIWKLVFHCQKDKQIYCQEILEHASMVYGLL
jgi:hypothetical protein